MKRLILRGYWITWSILTGIAQLQAQSPTHIDTRKKEPQRFTLDDILLYIVFPLILAAIAIWANRYRKKQKEKEADHQAPANEQHTGSEENSEKNGQSGDRSDSGN